MTARMAEKACQAWWILEAAALRGLPEPYVVRVTNHSVTDLGVKTVDELNTWAEALGVDPVRQVSGESVHLVAAGTLHDFEVTVHVVTTLAGVRP